MKHFEVAVLSAVPGLRERLEARVPGMSFVATPTQATSVEIVDVDGDEGAAGRVSCRIVLGGSVDSRSPGEVRLPAEAFEPVAGCILALCRELVEARAIATGMEREIEYLESIHELSRLGDAKKVSERITRTVLDMLQLQAATLLLHDPRAERYVVSFSNDSSFRDTGDFVPGLSNDLLQSALSSPSHYATTRLSDRSEGLIAMPIAIGDDVIGILRVVVPAGHGFDSARAERAGHYIGMVTSVLGNIYQVNRSRDLALRDDLTRAYNRRFFESYLDEEIERSHRYGWVVSIIFLDLDDLKTVNNLHGHLTGSRTLQEVARRMLAAVRSIDKVVRFGGDEFCVILPQTDDQQAKAVASRVLRSIYGSPIQVDDIQVSISASAGIASYPVHASTKEALVQCADAAMFRVKSTTKNAIEVAERTTHDGENGAPPYFSRER